MAIPTAISFCTGYDGIGLALKRVIKGIRTICYVEIEAYAAANLVAKIKEGSLDEAPVWSNITTFDCEPWIGKVDIFHGGYPCQGFSSAGKRGGADDPRHLWPFVRRAVEIIRPRYCFFENVDGHVSLGLREVLTELALLGYRVENSRGEPTWGVFSAAEVGAPHNRKRVFILGKRNDIADEWNWLGDSIKLDGRQGTEGKDWTKTNHLGVGQADANQQRSQGRIGEVLRECSGQRSVGPGDSWHWPGFVARPGEAQHEWEPSRVTSFERGVGRSLDGRARNVDALRLLGNGVYPATAALAFVTLYNRFKK